MEKLARGLCHFCQMAKASGRSPLLGHIRNPVFSRGLEVCIDEHGGLHDGDAAIEFALKESPAKSVNGSLLGKKSGISAARVRV